MIIYSEILNKEFESVDACLKAEREHEIKLKEEEEALKAEAERIELSEKVNTVYSSLVDNWIEFINCFKQLGLNIEDIESKTLLFMEVILDAEERDANRSKN